MTNDPPPLTLSFPFPVNPVPVPVPLPAVAVAPAPVGTPDTADVQLAEPQTPEQPQLPTQGVRFINDDISQTNELPNFTSNDSSDSSADTTCKILVLISLFLQLIVLKAQRLYLLVQTFLILLISDRDFATRDYHGKAIQSKTPPKIHCIPVSEPTISANQLTPSQQ